MPSPLRTTSFALALALAMILSQASWALAQATPQRAAAIAQAVEEGLAQEFPPGAEGLRLDWRRPVQAVPAGDGYELRIPEVAVVGTGGARLVLGTLRIDVTPGPDDTWAYEMTLPERAEGLDAQGRPAVEARLGGGRKVTGTWSAALGKSLRIEAGLSSLSVLPLGVPDAQRQGLRIGRLGLSQTFEPTGRDRWNGPFELGLDDLKVLDPAGKPLASLARLSLRARMGGVDLRRYAAFERATKAVEALLAQTDPASPPTPEVWAAIGRLLQLGHDLLDDASMELSASGISLRDDEGTDLRLKDLSSSVRVSGLRAGRSALSIRHAQDGLQVDPLPPSVAQFVPRDAELALTLDDIPNAAVWKALTDLAAAGAAGDPGAEVRFGAEIAEALAAAGTEFRVDGMNLSAPAMGAAASGLVKAAPAAALGAVGEADLVLRGLDAAIAALTPPRGQRATPEDQEILGVLALVQALGQAATDGQGRQIRRYAFRLGEDGTPTLNGTDLTPLLGLGEPGAPPPAAPRTPLQKEKAQ